MTTENDLTLSAIVDGNYILCGKADAVGEINCADALALYRLMSSISFLNENA